MILIHMCDSFGLVPPPDLVPNSDAELRAADAQRPRDYRNAVDRAGAGVDVRVVIALVIIGAVVVWFLAATRS